MRTHKTIPAVERGHDRYRHGFGQSDHLGGRTGRPNAAAGDDQGALGGCEFLDRREQRSVLGLWAERWDCGEHGLDGGVESAGLLVELALVALELEMDRPGFAGRG